MRTFFIFLVIILWFILGFFYWKSAKNCCTPDKDTTSEVIPPVKKEVRDCPLCFNWSNASPVLGNTWMSMKDSIRGLKNDNNLLQITGLYRSDESNSTNYENLGLARADSVRARWFADWDKDDVRLNARLVNTRAEEKTELFESSSFKYLVNTANVKEVDDKTIIRFPYNSTKKLDASDVESYLNDVADRVKASKETISLTGHTDSAGDDQSNRRLGLARANVIKDYLLRRGVPSSQIKTNSLGESKPIATNATNAGRAENRRTELQIIK